MKTVSYLTGRTDGQRATIGRAVPRTAWSKKISRRRQLADKTRELNAREEDLDDATILNALRLLEAR